MTAAEQGQGTNLRSAKKVNARSAELRLVGKRIALLALLISRASAPKEMHVIIGILLSADVLRRATAQLVSNAASYTHLETLRLHPHQSRKATILKIKKEKERRLTRKKAKPSPKAECFSEFLRLRIPALLPSNLRLCASVSFLKGSRSRTRSFQLM